MSRTGGRAGGRRWARPRLTLALAALAASGHAAASSGGAPFKPPPYAVQVVDSLPSYRPQGQVTGTIRLWGHGSPQHDFLGRLVRRWTAQFRRYQPGVRIVDRMYGTASAIGALASGAGDLAILGEELSPAEKRTFERARRYPPTRIEIATGSLETNYFDYAHMVFVERTNPIGRLSLGQLAAIFGVGQGRGGRTIRTWGQLGLGGSWADRRIDPYFWKVNQDFALFFRGRVLAGSHHWNPRIREFVTIKRPHGGVDDRGLQILKALARDPDGIAVSNVRFANPQVRALELAFTRSGPYVSATPRTLITERYPLTRIIPAYIDRAPGQPVAPALTEFLRFILSRQGQRALIEESGYLPLGRRQVREQLLQLQSDAGCAGGRSTPCPLERAPVPRAVRVTRRLAASSSIGLAARSKGEPVLRVWGNPALAPLLHRWVRGFSATHRHVRIVLHMAGSDIGMAGLYTGEADISLMGRPATASELKAFEWVYRHAPLRVEILRGSLASRGRSPALVAFVHAGNPLSGIDFAQLQGLLEARPPSGVPSIHTWGELGVRGTWAAHAVHLYVPDTESGTGRFLRDTVLGGSALLEWPRITEIGSAEPASGAVSHTRGRILSALARDPYGLAIAWLPPGAAPVKPVPLGVSAAGPYALPTVASIRDGCYPLGRAVYAYLDPSQDAPSEARKFVRYILSPKGQAAVHRGDGYLPLMTMRPGDRACERH
jgi:phosphate transport system substrate-binding protein